MTIRVMKFGGTSVQDADAIRRLITIVQSKKEKRWVVVSALARVTDALVKICDRIEKGQWTQAQEELKALEERHLELAQNLNLQSLGVLNVLQATFAEIGQILVSLSAIGEVSERSRDRIVAVGELCSSQIIAAAFKAAGVSAQWIDARQVMRTDSSFMRAQVDFEGTARKTQEAAHAGFENFDVLVVGGFVGSDGKGMTTTLGRGGSDYSAAIFGAALNANEIEIWTDVDGILTTDPRQVSSAKRILQLSFDEAAELAYFGAKVLHPATILPAVQKDIPVLVLNSKNPSCSGTRITQDSNSNASVIKAIAFKSGITLVNIYSTRMLGAAGFLRSVFEAFARQGVSIDLISTSEVNVSLTLDRNTDRDSLSKVVNELSAFSKVSLDQNRASIAAVGKGIRQAAGVAARIFGALKGISISMISMGSSEVNLSVVVDEKDLSQAVTRLHDEFFSKNLDPSIFASQVDNRDLNEGRV